MSFLIGNEQSMDSLSRRIRALVQGHHDSRRITDKRRRSTQSEIGIKKLSESVGYQNSHVIPYE